MLLDYLIFISAAVWKKFCQQEVTFRFQFLVSAKLDLWVWNQFSGTNGCESVHVPTIWVYFWQLFKSNNFQCISFRSESAGS